MRITRHFVEVDGRFVHYRRAGSGPPLLMVHQSPRSSAEYVPLMQEWGRRFTCIAPDTPGFGQSDPLHRPDATIDDFGDALVRLLDALGLAAPVAAWGFHSGGIILMNLLRRHPGRLLRVAIGGYAIWTEAERALFAGRYLPPLLPMPYGEHLTWLWNRMLEQSWFFPWFAVDPAHRLPGAHDDVARVDQAVREMLDAGDAYRIGYGAVLAAPRDVPPPEATMPPVLITAYDGDPLQAHIDRLGPMPAGWSAHKVSTPAEQQALSLDFLSADPGGAAPPVAESARRGFAAVRTDLFEGLLHWRGAPGETALVAAPGESAALGTGAAIDPPGHGLSDDWTGPAPATLGPWEAVLDSVSRQTGLVPRLPAASPGDAERLFPSLEPDRFGSHLTRAWAIVRAGRLFEPWYRADAAHARPFDPQHLDPARLAVAHLARLQARGARAWWQVLGTRA
ncbi:MAG: alpha/beta fold hydrolase [Sphingomonadaceae bacterium]